MEIPQEIQKQAEAVAYAAMKTRNAEYTNIWNRILEKEVRKMEKELIGRHCFIVLHRGIEIDWDGQFLLVNEDKEGVAPV